MSNQIELAGHEGDVVLVNGICYAFTEYTAPVVIDCNDCAPYTLAQAYIITLSGLETISGGWYEEGGSTWAVGNGTYIATWGDRPANYDDHGNDCDWLDSRFAVHLARDSGAGNKWEVSLRPYRLTAAANFGNEMRFENGPTDPCNPVGDYGDRTWCDSCIGGTASCIVTEGLEVTAAFDTCEECPS